MARTSRLIILCIALLMVGVAASAAVYPTVDFLFDPATCQYTWTVNYPADSTYNFAKFQVDASLAWVWTSYSGPAGWSFQPAAVGDGTYGFYWLASADATRKPGTAWTGAFSITVPDTTPQPGIVQTSAGVVGRQNVTSMVPVPEPSSLAAFASMVAGLGVLKLRKVKK